MQKLDGHLYVLFAGSKYVIVCVSLTEFKQFLCHTVVNCIASRCADTTLGEVLSTDAYQLL